MINSNDIKNSKISKSLMKWANTNIVAKFMLLIVIWAVVSIPFDLYLLVRWGIGPENFWQELAMVAVAVVAIGWLQGILLFFGIILSIGVILEDF